MHTEGRDQELVFATGYDHREVVVDAFVQVVEYGKTVCCSEMNLGLLNRIRLLFNI
jgi:hypothetical protein